MSLSYSSASFTVTGTTTLSSNIVPTSAITSSETIITFNFSSLITTDLSANSIITITVNAIRNYYSFKPILPILTTYTSDSF